MLAQYLTTFQRMNSLVIRKCALKSWVKQLLKLNHVEHYQLLRSTSAVALGRFCVSSFLSYSNFSRASGSVNLRGSWHMQFYFFRNYQGFLYQCCTVRGIFMCFCYNPEPVLFYASRPLAFKIDSCLKE